MKPRCFCAVCGVLIFIATRLAAQTTISVPLATDSSSKLNLGFFAGGTVLQVSVTGQGDLVNATYQTNPNGSLAAVATGNYVFANQGAALPTVNGFPSSTNSFSGGGANWDFSSSGFGFAGPQTNDTTDSSAIRFGAVVGTFPSSPTRADWFVVGYGGNFTVPPGGSDFFVAVNDSYNPDNHGNYALTYSSVPEPAAGALYLALAFVGFALVRRCRVASKI